MDKDSAAKALESVSQEIHSKAYPERLRDIALHFAEQYIEICAQTKQDLKLATERLLTYIHYIEENAHSPFSFAPYHKAVKTPRDYTAFALDMVRPLIDSKNSTLETHKNLDTITDILSKGENVILLANHQSEADPQALGLLLEKDYPHLADKLTFVAGDRVTSDPMAVPFSMGCNLFCIFSKRHIANPPEEKQKKLHHNQKTMNLLSTKLREGGMLIYVAPSGGRDRANKDGIVEVSPFDSSSIELFSLLAKKAGTKTHFFPLALHTYEMLPPPSAVEHEIGETRVMNWGPIHARFLEEIDMDNFPNSSTMDKRTKREARAKYIHALVKQAHEKLLR